MTTLAESSFDHLEIAEPTPGIHVVTLSRPDKLNALHQELFDELGLLCRLVRSDKSVRVIVLTGAGRGFCAGADLATITALPDQSVQQFMQLQENGARVIADVKQLPVPVIAAVNGPAAGGGLALALASDVRIASEAARFTVAFPRLGLSGCDVGVSWLMPRIVGLGHASQLMLTGESIDAAQAFRIGMVNEVVPDDELLSRAVTLAKLMSRNSPFGLQLTKEGLERNVDAGSLEAAIALENRNQVLASRTHDAVVAMTAYMTKTDPEFTGR